MKLLDTHVLLWRERGDRRLGQTARGEIDVALSAGNAAVSVISFWEVAMRVQKGHLDFFLESYTWRLDLIEQGLAEIPLDGNITVRAGLLPDMHGDPCDRLIVATALEGHELVTADERLLEWPGPLSRIDARQ